MHGTTIKIHENNVWVFVRKLFFVAEFAAIVSMVDWCKKADTENGIFVVEVLT
jgi:hypothetical protein